MNLPPLIKATLIKRYKRFLADVILETGEKITVYCPNTGAMTGCAEPGFSLWLSTSDNPRRKYLYTWELVQNDLGDMICIYSAKANQLVKESIERGVIQTLKAYDRIQTEIKYGEENSRIDLLLSNEQQQCFVEIKSVTYLVEDGLGVFPDAVSQRGSKHLRELIAMVEQGHRAVLVFCVFHTGIEKIAPADRIDKKYADTFRQALDAGVEVLAYHADISLEAMSLTASLPVLLYQP